ncbi:hypothetical protein HMPREF3193_00842 [Bifidobacterium breve]|nr:hypothetical protein HMPREF1587_00416 [Bifidobacterium breve JCP7499]KWZ85876.1 hypothetical protein HMPREF3193_00842 [Bifidobacterium breve]
MGEDRRRHYDDGFRREALEPVRAGTGSRTLARRLAMPRQTPKQWILLYGSNGEEALRPKPKGRPKGVKSKPKPKPTREHELAEENAYLRAKVAYLKNSGPCGRTSHAARAKRRRPTALRARTPARPPAEDSGAGQIHVLLPSVASGACDAP